MRMRSAFDSTFQLCNGIDGSNEGAEVPMSDYYLIEGSVSIHTQPSASTWRMYGKTNTILEARELAAKAIKKTNYLNVRIRKVWITQPNPHYTNQD